MDASETSLRGTDPGKEAHRGEFDPRQVAVEQILNAERERIAGVLHNEILQAFAACLVKAQLCERLVQKERYDLLSTEMPLLQESVNQAIDAVRRLETTLRKPESELN